MESQTRAAVAREVLRRAEVLGVEVREHTPAESVPGDVLVIACGPWSPELARTVGVELPIRPLVRQLLETSPLPERAGDAADGDRGRDRLPFPPARRHGSSSP